jgi:hypothetical protein
MPSIFENLYAHVDAILIYFFRLSDNPMLGYLVGIAVLALVCVVLGDLTVVAAYRVNGAFFRQDSRELISMQNKSLLALRAQDKQSYQACNEMANDSFGKVFFSQIAIGASSLWPVPFALQWLDGRFADVTFILPFALGSRTSVGYAFTFIPLYILLRILFGHVRTRLPGYRALTMAVRSDASQQEKMLTMEDVFPVRKKDQDGHCGALKEDGAC